MPTSNSACTSTLAPTQVTQTRGLHLLAAFLTEEDWAIAQVEVDGKENEIAAAARVLKCMDLRGQIVT